MRTIQRDINNQTDGFVGDGRTFENNNFEPDDDNIISL
jgi:hypothetical protein